MPGILRESLDKLQEKAHNYMRSEYWHTEHGRRKPIQRNGVKIPDAETAL